MTLSTNPFISKEQLANALSFNSSFGVNNLVDILYAQSGAGTPTGTSTSPSFIGQWYYDTTNKVWYRAVDVTGVPADFQAVAGTSVQGPASSTDKAVAIFNGTSGELIQNSVVTITSGAVAGVTSLAMGGALTGVTSLTMTGSLNYKGNATNPLVIIEKTVTAALLDGALSIEVVAAGSLNQWKCRDILVKAGGTNFGAGGNRDIVLQDSSGSQVLATIANSQLESLPATGMRLGITGITANKPDTATTAGEAIVLKYSGGTTDHSATGSFVAVIWLEKVA